jgi:hypothetical protein
MRLFFGKPKPKPVDLVNNALRGQVAVGRFQVSPNDAKLIRDAETRGGHAEGLRVVLDLLRKRDQARRNS